MFTYFLCGEKGRAIKVGKTTDIRKRVPSLQTGREDILECIFMVPGDYEKAFMTHLKDHHVRGEFYAYEPTMAFINQLRLGVKNAVLKNLGLPLDTDIHGVDASVQITAETNTVIDRPRVYVDPRETIKLLQGIPIHANPKTTQTSTNTSTKPQVQTLVALHKAGVRFLT
jgi:hypothetical protein